MMLILDHNYWVEVRANGTFFKFAGNKPGKGVSSL